MAVLAEGCGSEETASERNCSDWGMTARMGIAYAAMEGINGMAAINKFRDCPDVGDKALDLDLRFRAGRHVL
jgi:hypothetical protein